MKTQADIQALLATKIAKAAEMDSRGVLFSAAGLVTRREIRLLEWVLDPSAVDDDTEAGQSAEAAKTGPATRARNLQPAEK